MSITMTCAGADHKASDLDHAMQALCVDTATKVQHNGTADAETGDKVSFRINHACRSILLTMPQKKRGLLDLPAEF